MQENGIVYVTFLDDFCMTYNGIILDDSRINSDKIIKLLSYVICHNNNNISVGELSEALWNDEESDNPANALKNLVYRTRNVLKKYYGKTEFIKTGRGYYSWNKDISIKTDAKEFELMCIKAENEGSETKRAECQKRAVGYYKKHFLEKYTDCYWIVTLNAYYHTMYIEEIIKLSKLLYAQKDYKVMERVCSEAFMTDELSEDVHYYYMRALIGQNRIMETRKHFIKLEQLFKERLCARPSPKLYSLNQSINVQDNNKNFYRYSHGAVVCDYDNFLKNCEIEKRRMRRNNNDAYMVVFNSNFNIDKKQCEDIKKSTNDELYPQKRTDTFLYTLTHSLRESDIVSMSDKTHYIILLPDCSIDNVRDIIKRILDNCRKGHIKDIPEYKLKRLVCDVES